MEIKNKDLCYVLGLGSTIYNYKPDGNTVFGVNDICNKHEVDYLVCLHKYTQFEDKKRAEIIKNSNPKKAFYSQYDWYKKNQVLLTLSGNYLKHDIDDKLITLHSNNTPFVACVLAYKKGFKNIVMYGCDFVNHPHIKIQSPIEKHGSTTIRGAKVLLDFERLFIELKKKGVNLFIGSSGSNLSYVLPIYKKQ